MSNIKTEKFVSPEKRYFKIESSKRKRNYYIKQGGHINLIANVKVSELVYISSKKDKLTLAIINLDKQEYKIVEFTTGCLIDPWSFNTIKKAKDQIIEILKTIPIFTFYNAIKQKPILNKEIKDE